MGLDVGSRTTNFLRSAVELITMRSPVGAISDVLHDIPQRGSELGVLCEHGAHHAEEYGDITSKSRSGLRREIKLRKWRIRGIAGGRGTAGRGNLLGRRSVGRRNLLDVDSCVGGSGDIITKHSIDVNRRFLWGVVGEDGSGRRGGIGLASFALISQCRCGGPGRCGGHILGHAGAKGGVSTHLGKLEFVPGSGTDLTTIEGIESRNPLPIIIDNVLAEWDGSEGVVGGNLAEPVRDRRGVWEWLLVDASNDAEIYDRETSKWGVRIGSVVIFKLILGAKSNFVTIGVGIRHSDVLDGDAV